MVTVRRTGPLNADELLDHATRQWSRLPEVETTIDDWPEEVMIDFLSEWPLEEMHLERFQAQLERGELTAGQQAKYRQLVELAERNRPIIDRLINGSPADVGSLDSHDIQNGQTGAL